MRMTDDATAIGGFNPAQGVLRLALWLCILISDLLGIITLISEELFFFKILLLLRKVDQNARDRCKPNDIDKKY
jgi:hypothetical protein